MIIAILKMKSQNRYCSAACNKLKMCNLLSMLLSSLLYSPSDWASVVYASKSVNQFSPWPPPTLHDKRRPSLAFGACQWSNVITSGCENSYRYYFRKIITLKFPYCYIVRSAPSIKTITAVTTILLFFLRAPELKSWKNFISLELSWESYSQLSGFWMIWGLSPFYPS